MLIIGAANLIADGLSMGVGNNLCIRSHESALAAQGRAEEEAARLGTELRRCSRSPWRVPYRSRRSPSASDHGFAWSTTLIFVMLFTVGALRGVVTIERWWIAGFEMLLLGAAVAMAAYGSGMAVATLL